MPKNQSWTETEPLYLAVVPLYAYPSYQQITMNRNSMPSPIRKTQLSNNSFTDGLTKFKSSNNWQLDTIIGNTKQGYMFAFNSYGKRNVLVHSFTTKCNSRLEYYQILNNTCNHILGRSPILSEVKNGEIIINKNVCYYECYNISNNDIANYRYWSHAVLCDSASYKVIELSYLSNNWRVSERQIMEFMKSVTFKLK